MTDKKSAPGADGSGGELTDETSGKPTGKPTGEPTEGSTGKLTEGSTGKLTVRAVGELTAEKEQAAGPESASGCGSIDITDDYIFSTVMQDLDICMELLKYLLPD